MEGHRGPPSLVSGELLLISPAQALEHLSAWLCPAAAMAVAFCLPQGTCAATCPPPVSLGSPGILHPVPTPSVAAGVCSQACELPVPIIYAPILSQQSREREPKPPLPPLLAPASGTHRAPRPPWPLGEAARHRTALAIAHRHPPGGGNSGCLQPGLCSAALCSRCICMGLGMHGPSQPCGSLPVGHPVGILPGPRESRSPRRVRSAGTERSSPRSPDADFLCRQLQPEEARTRTDPVPRQQEILTLCRS